MALVENRISGDGRFIVYDRVKTAIQVLKDYSRLSQSWMRWLSNVHKKSEELDANPKYKAMWMRICQTLVDTGKSQYSTAQELYDWWIEKNKNNKKNCEDQIGFDFEEETV